MNLVRIEPHPVIFLRLLLVGLVSAGAFGPPERACGQPATEARPPDTVDRGFVWTPPSEPGTALQALNRMREAGATAVRVTTIPGDSVVDRADALDLRLYVDLPVPPLSAAQARGAVDQLPPNLDQIRTLAERYPAVAFVGLGDIVDSTVPDVCAALARWTERVHSEAPALQTYYVTSFRPAKDRCTESVDRVLLNLRASAAPMEHWNGWQSENQSVGIGALGTWVRPGTAPGLEVPHSPERQARYLERALRDLLTANRPAPPALFVFRWQDASGALLPSRQYGLHKAEGTPRPAAAVVKGFYTGTQRVFAYPAGETPRTNHHVLLLIGWGLLAILGGIYTQSLFVRRTVVRYFTAHGFYRDALREGRDLHPGVNSLLLGVVVVAVGATSVLAARLAATRPVTERVVAALPADLASVVVRGIEQPALAGIAVATLTAVIVLVWMVALVGTARRWSRFSVAQGLLIVVWPSWPALAALPVALATTPDSIFTPSLLALYLLAGTLSSILYYTIRVLGDYRAVTNVPWPALLPLAGLSPLTILGVALLVLAARHDVSLLFLWDLATKTF